MATRNQIARLVDMVAASVVVSMAVTVTTMAVLSMLVSQGCASQKGREQVKVEEDVGQGTVTCQTPATGVYSFTGHVYRMDDGTWTIVTEANGPITAGRACWLEGKNYG